MEIEIKHTIIFLFYSFGIWCVCTGGGERFSNPPPLYAQLAPPCLQSRQQRVTVCNQWGGGGGKECKGGCYFRNIAPPPPTTYLKNYFRRYDYKILKHTLATCQSNTLQWPKRMTTFIWVGQGLLYHRTCKRDFLCSWPSLNSYLK